MALILALSGCADRQRVQPPVTGPETAEEYTARGWQNYENDRLEDALSDFLEAIARDANFGAAHSGLGWTHAARATSASSFQSAVNDFTAAEALGETGAQNLAGRAAARLGAGGTNWSGAVSDAAAALAASPSFVFTHRASIDAKDLELIRAFGSAAQGLYDQALEAADAVEASGIDRSNSATWQGYSTFEGAVLHQLQALSNRYAG